MNKFLLLGVIMFILVFMTYIVGLTEAYSVTSDINNSLESTDTASVGSILAMISTFWSVLSFQIEGMPAIINMFFYALSVVVVYMIIDVLKDLVFGT